MIYLLLTILCSSLLVFMFKVFERFEIEVFPAIVFNYITCVICGFLNSKTGPPAIVQDSLSAPWFWLTIVMGFSFINIFSLTSMTALRFGVSTASVAMKLGLVIPVMLAFFLYGEAVTIYKVAGILCAVVAVVLSSYKNEKNKLSSKNKFGLLSLLPVFVFVGSGLCDSGAQLGDKIYFPDGGSDHFVLFVFFFAAVTGLLYLGYSAFRHGYSFRWKQVAGGIALGIPNYGSLLFLMKSLDKVEGGSSLVFPVVNISTVAGSTLLSILFFREQLNIYNRLGLVFAALCIIFIYLPKIIG